MLGIEVKGLEELQRKLRRLPKELQKEIERKLREEANRIVLSAQMKCPDAELREKITSRIASQGKRISIEISAPEGARQYLRQAYEEHKDSISKLVAEAVKRVIEN